MATAQFPLVQHPGVRVVALYDDVSGAVSQVQATNQSAADCGVTLRNIANPALQRSGTLRAGQAGSIAVNGAASLTFGVVVPATSPSWSLQGWTISSRWPA